MTIFFSVLLVLLLSCSVLSAASDAAAAAHMDGDWFRKSLLDENLSRWLNTTQTENGFFACSLDRRWQRAGKQSATLVSQCRLLHNFAVGYDLTGEQRYLDAVKAGSRFLLTHMRDTEKGGWFWECGPDGKVSDDSKSAYGHAFVIFGMAHAYRVTKDPALLSAADETWATIQSKLIDRHGGIRLSSSRDFSADDGKRSQNPMMHLFEALLALHRATNRSQTLADAERLADFIFTRMYNAGAKYLPETYDAEWKPLPAEQGGGFSVGHQLEWAYLLSQGVRQGMPEKYLAIGQDLLDTGMRHGYDHVSGGVFSHCDYDGKPAKHGKVWWAQTELLRTLMDYAARRGRPDLWPAFDQSLALVKTQFIDPEYGGWYESVDPTNPARSKRDKGSIWKLGYHETGMYLEALQILNESADALKP